MEKQTIKIPGGTVILNGRSADRLDKRDPYDGLLLPKRRRFSDNTRDVYVHENKGQNIVMRDT